MASQGILIRRAWNSDTGAMVSLHVSCLPDDPAVMLGKDFLEAELYPFLLRAGGCAFIAESPEGEVVGFVVFSSAAALACRGVAKALLLRVLSGDISLFNFFAKAINVGAFVVSTIGRIPSGPELSWIAVNSQHRQIGVGSLLVSMGIRDLERQGFTSCWVKTLGGDGRTVSFYRRQGFLPTLAAARRVILQRDFRDSALKNSSLECTP